MTPGRCAATAAPKGVDEAMASKARVLSALGDVSIERFRGERLRALLDAASDVAKGSEDPRLQYLARRIMEDARLRGVAS